MASRMRIVFAAAALTARAWPAGRRTAQQPPAQQAAAATSRRQPIAAAAACLPHRHQLRPRRRDRLGQGRQPGRGLEAGRLRRDRRRQAAENRNLQAGQARRRHAATPIKEPPREIRTDYDEEMEAARDDVRLFAIFLDDYHVRTRRQHRRRANQLSRFIETQLGPSDMVGVMYPLESTASVRMTRNHSAVMRGLAAVRGAQVRLHAEEPVRGAVRELSDRNGRAHPQSGVAVGD